MCLELKYFKREITFWQTLIINTSQSKCQEREKPDEKKIFFQAGSNPA